MSKGAAELLGIKRTTLQARMRKLGIKRPIASSPVPEVRVLVIPSSRSRLGSDTRVCSPNKDNLDDTISGIPPLSGAWLVFCLPCCSDCPPLFLLRKNCRASASSAILILPHLSGKRPRWERVQVGRLSRQSGAAEFLGHLVRPLP